MTERFDLVVIGAGPAGEKGAAQAAYFGKRVAIVDQRPDPGGAAAGNAGVIPSKTLREAALYLGGYPGRDIYGLGMELTRDTILEHMRARTEDVVRVSVEAVRSNLERHGIEFVVGKARLEGPRRVRVSTPWGERMLRAEVVLVATGSRVFHPPGVPFDDPDVHDSDSILGIERIPSRLVVIGGGPVGCEYASIFLALGVDVALLDRGHRLLPFADAEVSDCLARAFQRHGMDLFWDTTVAAVERNADRLVLTLADGRRMSTGSVLFASGRAGVTRSLGLEEIGIRTDERGRIVVDETYRTSIEGIFAAGDVIGPPGLASAAMEQGRVAACHAFGISFKDAVDPLAPLGVYSIPELAMVGMGGEAAREQGVDVEAGRALFEENARAGMAGAGGGMLKLVFGRHDRRLVGVHVVGDDATELVHIGQAVLHTGGTVDHFIHSTFNVPTLSETYKYAAYDGLQRLSGHLYGGGVSGIARHPASPA